MRKKYYKGKAKIHTDDKNSMHCIKQQQKLHKAGKRTDIKQW